MARNWKVGEAVNAIKSGTIEEKLDIGRRFPLFAILAGQTNEAGVELLNTIPDYVTARKLESVLKGDAQESDGDEGGSGDDEKPAEKSKEKEKPAGKDSGKKNEIVLDGKSPKELYEICVSLGIKVEKKKPADVYIKAIKKHQEAEAKKAAKASEKDKPKDDDWGDDEGGKDAGKEKGKSDDDDWDI